MWPDHQDEDPDVALAAITDATIEERRGRVLLMRLAGGTFTAIAKDQGISITTARKDYDIALSAHMQDTPQVGIARHRAIITDILRANYPKMMEGDKDAAATILRALDRDAKLNGYDAPTRVLASVSDVEFANEAARLIGRIQEIDPTALKELTRVGPRPQEPLDVETVDDPPADQDRDDPGGQRGGGEPSPPAWPADPVAYVDYVPEGEPDDTPEPGDSPAPERSDAQGTGADTPGDTGVVQGAAGDADGDSSDYLDGWSNID